MTFAWPDHHTDDATRRARLRAGEVLVYPASTPSLTLVSYARSTISAAFGRLDPELAQFVLAEDEFASIVADLDATFDDRSDSAALIRDTLRFCGCDLDTTCFDVPRLHTSASDTHPPPTSSGRSPHRAEPSPPSLINCVIPIYPVSDRGAVMMFSGGQQDHANTSGRTRFSIEFRTLDIADVNADTAERDGDIESPRSSARDFVRAADIKAEPDDAAIRHESHDREGYSS